MRRAYWWAIGLGVGTLVVLAAIVLLRTIPLRSAEEEPAGKLPEIRLDSGAVVERFAAALRYRTVSYQDTAQIDRTEFERFHQFLQHSFPRVHQQLEWERVGGYSLLYRWRGQDSTLPAVLLMGHMDVVPIEPGTEHQWRYPPFGGVVAEGSVWGRGAIDDKITVMGILEAAEALLREGFRPKRDVYFAFGHDEEIGGRHGAQQIVALLKQRGVRLELSLIHI